ncbi:MAG TPA: HAMP domain-containing sensor histidine kinase [Paracoccus sp. (in: a-proteobacteria)]|nr:HAMP domain-containing sensor histidine kinase [Paracoccus sp. (in: a-proteobacteria)]
MPRSLQARLALAVGLGITLLWLAAAGVTASRLRAEMDEVFDSALQETAQRILQLAVIDILGREDDEAEQRVAALRAHEEFFTYVVRDAQGGILLASHAADPAVFPPFGGVGFGRTPTHRIYADAAVQDTITIAVAEPLAHRAAIAREVQVGLVLPLLVVVPLSLAVIVGAVRLSLRPLRRLRDAVAARSARDLAPVGDSGFPSEIAPIAAAMDNLLADLRAAFEAERSFAANAAHELRTPVAGAIAQAQRLRAETPDARAAARAADIETTLKRLARLSEKLMQLARAEGAQLRTGRVLDLRDVLRLTLADFGRSGTGERIEADLPQAPVLSDIDPDAFGILCRNLIENALRHDAPHAPIRVALTPDRCLTVTNDCPPVPPGTLARLASRFERGSHEGDGGGSGLGLAIVRTIADRTGAGFEIRSPATGRADGFQVTICLPPAARA